MGRTKGNNFIILVLEFGPASAKIHTHFSYSFYHDFYCCAILPIYFLWIVTHPTFTTGESFFKSRRMYIRLKPSANMHFCENQHQHHLETDIINKKAEGKLRPQRHECEYKTWRVSLRSVQRLGEDNPRITWTQKPEVLYMWEMCMRSLRFINILEHNRHLEEGWRVQNWNFVQKK